MKKIIPAVILLTAGLSVINSSSAQVTIVSDGLNNTSTHFTVSGGAYYSGNSAAADRPATSPFFSEGTHGRGASSTDAILTSTSNINTSAYTNPTLSLRLAAFAIGGSSGNYGVEADDIVTVAISTNGGSTYTTYLTVTGWGSSSSNTNGSAWWAYSTGTGVAATNYGTAATFAPAGNGNRTTDGYSTLKINNLPSTTTLKVKITLHSTNPNERWVVYQFEIVHI